MLISDIGEIVGCYTRINQLDLLIDAAKGGKITVTVNGQNQGEEMAEAVQNDVVGYLRSQRSGLVRNLERWGFTE